MSSSLIATFIVKMKKHIKFDKKIRSLFLQMEIKMLLLKSIFFDRSIKDQVWGLSLTQSILLYKYFEYCKFSRIKEYCLLTGRARSVYQQFKMTRWQLKNLNSMGYITGLQKST
jgi:ribosomal protein S14